MNLLQFECPPFPCYMAAGEDTYFTGDSHVSRYGLGVFDMLFVTRGNLFMGENDSTWEVGAEQVLIMKPDRYQYAFKACEDKTHFYWLHFQVFNGWGEGDGNEWVYHSREDFKKEERKDDDRLNLKWFKIECPQYIHLIHPTKMSEHFKNLLELEYSPNAGARWKQQLIFQEMILDMHATTGLTINSNMQQIAERAATYIRKNYRNIITYDHIREALNFHPTYVSRCMKLTYGFTLNEYLIRYRIEQASLMLLTTNMPIHEIAEKTGFQNLSYFARKFLQEKGVGPRQYRLGYAK